MRADSAVNLMRRGMTAAAEWPWAEIAVTGALVSGWALLTWGVASLSVWQVWPISAGLLLLSLVGWRLLQTIAAKGLYALTRPPEGKR